MGQTLNIALLPGDGIGPEVMDVADALLEQLIQRYQLPSLRPCFPGHPMPGTSSTGR